MDKNYILYAAGDDPVNWFIGMDNHPDFIFNLMVFPNMEDKEYQRKCIHEFCEKNNILISASS